jgi:hypothetical protein
MRRRTPRRDQRIRHDLGRSNTARVIGGIEYHGNTHRVARSAAPAAPTPPVRPL